MPLIVPLSAACAVAGASSVAAKRPTAGRPSEAAKDQAAREEVRSDRERITGGSSLSGLPGPDAAEGRTAPLARGGKACAGISQGPARRDRSSTPARPPARARLDLP